MATHDARLLGWVQDEPGRPVQTMHLSASPAQEAATMNTWRLAWTYLWARPLVTVLNLLLLTLGLGAVSFVSC